MLYFTGLRRCRTLLISLLLLPLLLNSCSISEAPPASQQEQVEMSNLSGLTGAYFNNSTFEGTSVTRVDSQIDFSWNGQAPIEGKGASGYSVHWTGQVRPDATGSYTFSLATSGQARLAINGVVAAKVRWSSANEAFNQSVRLEAGAKYDLTLEYKPGDTAGSAIRLEWRLEDGGLGVVPSSSLLPMGSNVDDALATLTATAKFQNLATTFDLQSVVGSLTPEGFGVIVKEQGQSRIFIAILKGGVVQSFVRYGERSGNGELLNVLSGASTSLDPINSYFDESGNFTGVERFLARVGPVLEEDDFGRFGALSAAPSGGRVLQSAQFDFDWPLNPCGADCQDEWDAWNNATLRYVATFGEAVKNGIGCGITDVTPKT